MVIGPYAKPGYISHFDYDFTSILKFIEKRWDLPHLTPRDDRALDMRDCFNFEQKPNSTLPIALPSHLPPLPGKVRYQNYKPYITLPPMPRVPRPVVHEPQGGVER